MHKKTNAIKYLWHNLEVLPAMFPSQKATLCLYLDALSVPYASEIFEEAGI